MDICFPANLSRIPESQQQSGRGRPGVEIGDDRRPPVDLSGTNEKTDRHPV